jgi:light-regulated signal transduction histidine kinase (bacteriophytochrome)
MKEDTQTVDLDNVLNEVEALLEVKIEETGGVVRYGKMPVITGSHTLLKQLFQNLVGNAIKFRRESAPPVVNISATDAGEFWQFAVSDNGIGISPAYLERIFIIFQRLHTSQQFPGTGIGLAICKKIVEQQGGKIWVESKEGAGSTFYFTLRK